MRVERYTVDDVSGFQTEHAALLEKLATYKITVATLNATILKEITNENRSEADINNLIAEVAKLDAEQDYLDARSILFNKVEEIFPILEDCSNLYGALIPDKNEYIHSSDVILLYV